MTEKPQMLPSGQTRLAVPFDEGGADPPVGDVENGVGEVGKLLGDLGERGRAEDVAKGDADEPAAPEAREVGERHIVEESGVLLAWCGRGTGCRTGRRRESAPDS